MTSPVWKPCSAQTAWLHHRGGRRNLSIPLPVSSHQDLCDGRKYQNARNDQSVSPVRNQCRAPLAAGLDDVMRNRPTDRVLVSDDPRVAPLCLTGANRAWLLLRHRDRCRRAATSAVPVDYERGLANDRAVWDRGLAMVLFSLRSPRFKSVDYVAEARTEISLMASNRSRRWWPRLPRTAEVDVRLATYAPNGWPLAFPR